MKDVISRVIGNVIFWSGIFAYMFMQDPWKSYGENLVSFIGVLAMVLGVILAFFCMETAKRDVASGKYKQRSKIDKAYQVVSFSCRIIVLAALGWWWVMVGLFIAGLSSVAYYSCAKNEFESRN